MQSNKLQYFGFKYAFLGTAILLGVLSIRELYPYFSSGETRVDLWTILLLSLFGCAAMIIFLLLKDKFVRVELRNDLIKITQRNKTIEMSWLDVESITMIQFVQPPLYRLKLKNVDGYLLFNTSSVAFMSINGFTKDFSEMAKLITKKKRELGI